MQAHDRPAQHLYARVIGTKKRCRKSSKTLIKGPYSDGETFSQTEIEDFKQCVLDEIEATHKSTPVPPEISIMLVSGRTSLNDGIRWFCANLHGDTIEVI
jgi:hypothetical protein